MTSLATKHPRWRNDYNLYTQVLYVRYFVVELISICILRVYDDFYYPQAHLRKFPKIVSARHGYLSLNVLPICAEGTLKRSGIVAMPFGESVVMNISQAIRSSQWIF